MVAMELLQTVFDSADLQRWLLLISCAVLATIKIYQSFKEDNGWSGSKKVGPKNQTLIEKTLQVDQIIICPGVMCNT